METIICIQSLDSRVTIVTTVITAERGKGLSSEKEIKGA